MIKKTIPVLIALLIAGIAAIMLINPEQESDSDIVQGPVSINKQQYLLGENVFIKVRDLQEDDVGQISFVTPEGITYTSFPVSGKIKPDFNKHFTPSLSMGLKICTVKQIVGTWSVLYENISYDDFTFEIIEEYLDGAKAKFEPIC